MWLRLLPVVLLLLVAAATMASCGGGGSGSKNTPTANGPLLTDEQYLKEICTGTQNFSDALISKTTKEGIASVVQSFRDDMQSLNPPADLQAFNAQFVQYLDDALKEPTSLLTRQPPVPPSSVRDRLVSKEPNVPECSGQQTFFDAQAKAESSASATP